MVWKAPEVYHIWSAVGKGLGSEGIWTYFPHEIEKYKKNISRHSARRCFSI